jgi:hypothetical protein
MCLQSTLGEDHGSGHFYVAKNRTFLLCVDTFISENGDGSFRVGWFTRDAKYDSIKEFQNLADAATDYLLFSLGKGRWTPID